LEHEKTLGTSVFWYLPGLPHIPVFWKGAAFGRCGGDGPRFFKAGVRLGGGNTCNQRSKLSSVEEELKHAG
jgi:hypothetical protein